MRITETDLQAISIIEREIKSGKTIYDSYCVAAKELNIPIYKCNSRYYTKWRFNLSKEVKEIIEDRKQRRKRK